MSTGELPPPPLDMYAGTTNLQRALAITVTSPEPVTEAPPGVLVAILNLDRPDLLLPLLTVLADAPAAFASAGLGFQVVIGDTGSTDPDVLAAYASAPDWLQVVRGLDYHFSRCNNEVVAAAEAYDRVLLLNNDVVLPDVQPLLAMARLFDDNNRLGVVGLRLDFPDGSVQHDGIDFFSDGDHAGMPFHPYGGTQRDHRPGHSRDVLAVTGAALMTPWDLWQRLGGLDEAFTREAQDVDYCLAARRLGATVRVLDAGRVVHVESATRPAVDHDPNDRNLLLRRWRSFLAAEFR